MGSARCFTYFPGTMASFSTSTGEIDLGHSWSQVFLEIPTMTSNTQLHIKAAASSGGTYRRVRQPPLNSSTVGTNDFAIVSSATDCLVPIPSGLRYIKVEATATVSFTASFNIICGD
jgi:hypothetical protein